MLAFCKKKVQPTYIPGLMQNVLKPFLRINEDYKKGSLWEYGSSITK
jgi:hypothetical protein